MMDGGQEMRYAMEPTWPEKNRQMSKKLEKINFTRKFKKFDNFTKIA